MSQADDRWLVVLSDIAIRISFSFWAWTDDSEFNKGPASIIVIVSCGFREDN